MGNSGFTLQLPWGEKPDEAPTDLSGVDPFWGFKDRSSFLFIMDENGVNLRDIVLSEIKKRYPDNYEKETISMLGSGTIDSKYSLTKAALGTKLEDLSLFDRSSRELGKYLLLTTKVQIGGANAKQIYSFQTPFVKGFELISDLRKNDGKIVNHINILIFDAKDSAHNIELANLSLEEADFIIASIKPNAQ